MDEIEYKKYDVEKTLDASEVPEDTITIIVKSGKRTFVRGVYLADTQEGTAKLAEILMQQVVDTIDAKGLKKGGSLYDPKNSGKTVDTVDK